jgi:hypothetical protein
MKWGRLILGFLALGLVIWMYSSSKAGIDEANDIRANGWYYSGTSEVTNEQTDYLIQKYRGFHSGEVDVIKTDPLTIEYYFATKDTIPYLIQKPMTNWDKATAGISGALIPIMFAVPLLLIASSLPLGKEEKNKTEKSLPAKEK